MWENLRAIAISSIMTLIILGTLIWTGIVPIRQEANTYQIKQTIRENFNITGTATSQAFTIPIQNITGPAVARTNIRLRRIQRDEELRSKRCST